jgi:protein involved in ribonucleotide reduction
MIIVYASKTHNVERFCNKIDKYETIRVEDYTPGMGKYVLITYTTGFGDLPDEVHDFLIEHHQNMVGVCASGKQSWKLFGTYCKSADVVSEMYGVPVFLKFEMQGTSQDIIELYERIERVEQ